MREVAFPREIKAPSEYGPVLRKIAEQFSSSTLSITKEFGDGQSGARVYLLNIAPNDDASPDPSGHYILKLDRRGHRKGLPSAERHDKARGLLGQFGKDHVPEIVQPTFEADGQTGILFCLAGGGRSDYFNADSVVKRGEFWPQLAEDLLREFLSKKPVTCDSRQVTAKQCLRNWLDHRLDDTAFRQFVDEITRGGPSPWFRVNDTEHLCHPLRFYDELAGAYSEPRLRAVQHNDLHCGNVLVHHKNSRKYWIIDFEMFQEDSYIGYDHAYCEVSLLLKLLVPDDKVGRVERLLAILDALHSEPLRPVRLGIKECSGGDTLLLDCLHKGREKAERWFENSDHGARSGYLDEFRRQLVLGRIAAGLAFARMGELPHGEEDRRLALYYSAWYVKHFIKRHHNEYAEKPSLEKWDSGSMRVTCGFPGAKLPLGFTQVAPSLAQGCLVHALGWSPLGVLAVGRADGKVQLWSLLDEQTRVLNAHSMRVNALAWSPDGRKLATGSDDLTVRLWDIDDLSVHQATLKRPEQTKRIETVAWSSAAIEPRMLASGSEDGVICVWDLEAQPPALIKTLRDHRQAVMSCAWSPVRPMLASASPDGRCLVWDFSDPLRIEAPRLVLDRKKALVCVAWSPDGSRIITGSTDCDVQFWDAENGAHLISLQGHGDRISAVAFAPDDTLVATKSQDDTVRVWRRCRPGDDGSWEIIASLYEPAARAYPVDIAYYKDDSRLYLATLGEEDQAVRVWRIEGFASYPLG